MTLNIRTCLVVATISLFSTVGSVRAQVVPQEPSDSVTGGATAGDCGGPGDNGPVAGPDNGVALHYRSRSEPDADGAAEVRDSFAAAPKQDRIHSNGATTGVPLEAVSSCYPEPPGVVGWWPGNGSSADISGGHDGVPTNGASYAPGLVRESFSLDGIDDYVRIPNAPALNPSQMTVEAWIYPYSILPFGDENIAAIVSKGDTSWRLQIDSRSQRTIFFDGYCNGYTILGSGVIPPVNEWTHVAGTFDGTHQSVYVNGVLKAQIAVPCLATSGLDIGIGAAMDRLGRPRFDGLIDEVTIYSRALSAGELLGIYNAGASGKCRAGDLDGDGFVPPQDCDDSNPNVFPGATEVCNQLDDDCDGSADENLLSVTYQDLDADGYGNSNISQLSCSLPDGWTLTPGDCDDSRGTIYPGASEICDAADNDCDAAVDEDDLGADTDADGVHNACDNCRTAFNPDQFEADGDGVGNACDNCITSENPDQVDTDADGRGNACDNCPASFNTFQDDLDGDRRGDACDNCIFDFNPAQSDADVDQEGDLCDLDDGLIYLFATDPNYVEWQQEAGASNWNVYEGDLAALRAGQGYTQVPGSNAVADRHCGLVDPWVGDFESIPVGVVKFALVTEVSGGIEGSLGQSSSGSERTNSNPCP